MYNLYKPSDIKSLLKTHDFNFSKRLGQNFIINPNICPKMVEKSMVALNNGVIEIGPGIGTLTREIADRAKKVVAIEIDKKLLPILKETTELYDNIKIINDDILKIDIKEVIDKEFEGFKDIKICANLPYYITSPVIMKILESDLEIKSMTLMVQKEAATRICALPGTRECGALSVAVRYYGDPEILFDVPRGCFMPTPKVDSSVIMIKIDKSNSKIINNKDVFFKLIKSAFSQRRKAIVNSLGAYSEIDKHVFKKIFDSLGISDRLRAEDLTFLQFARISNAVNEHMLAFI